MSEDGYFLYHSIGMYPGKSRDLAQAMTDFAEIWGRADDGQWGAVLPQRAEFLAHWQAILHAGPGTVTSCENVTQGLHMILQALPRGDLAGRTVLVGADCFPSNHFLLQQMAERHGFTLKTVSLRQGAAHVEDEDFCAAWTRDVGVALLTWVSSTTSHRIDLSALVAHGRRMGSVIGVDITQAAGLIPFDVTAPKIDFALSTSLKWMCGTAGAGILYVDPAVISVCKPELSGWFSQENPFNWDITAFRPASDIRRFDNGTPGVMSAIASLPALKWHAAQDQSALLAHNRALTSELIALADELGLDLLTPRPEAQRGGSLMIRLPHSHPASEMVTALRAEGISADARGQTLRLSPGNLTQASGIARLETVLARTLQS
jgi:kynureninase